MLLGYDPLDLLLALGAGFACGFLNTAASSGSVVTLPIMIFLGLDAGDRQCHQPPAGAGRRRLRAPWTSPGARRCRGGLPSGSPCRPRSAA